MATWDVTWCWSKYERSWSFVNTVSSVGNASCLLFLAFCPSSPTKQTYSRYIIFHLKRALDFFSGYFFIEYNLYEKKSTNSTNFYKINTLMQWNSNHTVTHLNPRNSLGSPLVTPPSPGNQDSDLQHLDWYCPLWNLI